jgi:hypothetical protein
MVGECATLRLRITRSGVMKGAAVLRGFKNFLMQGDLIIIAVGLVVALAFSTLIKASPTASSRR